MFIGKLEPFIQYTHPTQNNVFNPYIPVIQSGLVYHPWGVEQQLRQNH